MPHALQSKISGFGQFLDPLSDGALGLELAIAVGAVAFFDLPVPGDDLHHAAAV